MTKQGYLNACSTFANSFLAIQKPLLRYKRDRNRRKIGVVLAFRDKGVVKIGYSKCHVSMEPFDKAIGIYKAYQRAKPVEQLFLDTEVPNSMRSDILEMTERANRYFKPA